MVKQLRIGSIALSCLFALVACGASSSNDAPANNGVDDVLAACAIRGTWAHAGAAACGQCMIAARAVRCPCESEPYAGACNAQQVAMNDEPACQGASGQDVTNCIDACASTDCACVAACYDGKPACRPRGDAVDGCLAAACDASCR